jgi:SAM-dependent methyltransferase
LAFELSVKFDRAYFEVQYRDYKRQNPPRKLAFYRRLAEMAAGSNPRPRVLDIGCAFGLFLSRLDSRWDRFGIDVSEYAILQAREQVPAVQFAVSPAEEAVFHGPFDVITAFDVLEHIPRLDTVRSVISESLVRGGGFVFVVPVYDGPLRPVVRALDRDPTHIHKESRNFWLTWAGEKFLLKDWWGIYRYLLPGGLYLHFPAHSIRRFAPAIACLLRRA